MSPFLSLGSAEPCGHAKRKRKANLVKRRGAQGAAFTNCSKVSGFKIGECFSAKDVCRSPMVVVLYDICESAEQSNTRTTSESQTNDACRASDSALELHH